MFAGFWFIVGWCILSAAVLYIYFSWAPDTYSSPYLQVGKVRKGGGRSDRSWQDLGNFYKPSHDVNDWMDVLRCRWLLRAMTCWGRRRREGENRSRRRQWISSRTSQEGRRQLKQETRLVSASAMFGRKADVRYLQMFSSLSSSKEETKETGCETMKSDEGRDCVDSVRRNLNKMS